jgi:hypothetical protein
MATDPYAPPANEKEQFHEVARILGVALHRWHRLHQSKVGRSTTMIEIGGAAPHPAGATKAGADSTPRSNETPV